MYTELKQPKAAILVVDDYVVTLRILSTQLRKGGYEVRTAGSGQEALALLEQHNFDLMIADIAMPEMDGITLLQRVRTAKQQALLPVIMLTASVLDEDRVRAQAAGATDFLTKPVSSWELLEVIQKRLTHAHSPTKSRVETRLL
jgi:CheY-like chemotaxis protein